MGDQIVNNALAQQKTVDRHLPDMENNRDSAMDAVDTGNTVLEKAQKTLEILQDFENRVNDNRAAAENALNIAIEDANNADSALLDTDTDSVTAYEIAIESKNTAEEASKNAKTINQESTSVLDKAEQL